MRVGVLSCVVSRADFARCARTSPAPSRHPLQQVERDSDVDPLGDPQYSRATQIQRLAPCDLLHGPDRPPRAPRNAPHARKANREAEVQKAPALLSGVWGVPQRLTSTLAEYALADAAEPRMRARSTLISRTPARWRRVPPAVAVIVSATSGPRRSCQSMPAQQRRSASTNAATSSAAVGSNENVSAVAVRSTRVTWGASAAGFGAAAGRAPDVARQHFDDRLQFVFGHRFRSSRRPPFTAV